ncbi:MAG: aldehyde dehydrogenase family protein, partial [Pseudomonadota bacterium]
MTIKDIFETMDYGTAPESASEALAWLVDHGSSFGHFINGAWTQPSADFTSRNPANGNTLADLSQATQADVDAAVAAARKAQGAWAKDAHARAKVLYAIARLLQKHSRLFAVLETLDNGKPIREARDIDTPLAQRHFYYHAGLAQLMPSALADRAPLGVCGQI